MDQSTYERKYANRSNYSNRCRSDDFLSWFRSCKFDAHATNESLMDNAEFLSVYDRIHPTYRDEDRAVLQVTMCVIETCKRKE